MSLLGTRKIGNQPSEKKRAENFKAQKEYHIIFNKWRDLDFLTTVLSMVGLVLAILNFEHDVKNNSEPIDKEAYPDPMSHPRNTDYKSCIFRMIIALTSAVSLVCLYMRHLYQLKWMNKFLSSDDLDPNHIKFMYDEIINSSSSNNEFGHRKHLITRYFVLEVLALSVCPIPYYD